MVSGTSEMANLVNREAADPVEPPWTHRFGPLFRCCGFFCCCCSGYSATVNHRIIVSWTRIACVAFLTFTLHAYFTGYQRMCYMTTIGLQANEYDTGFPKCLFPGNGEVVAELGLWMGKQYSSDEYFVDTGCSQGDCVVPCAWREGFAGNCATGNIHYGVPDDQTARGYSDFCTDIKSRLAAVQTCV